MTKNTLRTLSRWLPLFLFVSAPLMLVAGEWRYAASISPQGVRTVDDHVARFGRSEYVTPVQRQGDPDTYFELSGFPHDKPPRFAFPSASPAYIYDSSGTLVDWCGDPGDTDQWHTTWKRVSEPISEVEPVLQQLKGNGG